MNRIAHNPTETDSAALIALADTRRAVVARS
jgi:hypothetical protein